MKAKDQQFLEYYEKFKDKIFNYFWYRVNFNRDIAEDLTSEVFIKALSNFDSYDEDRSFQTWVYRIAHNHLVNYYRVCNRETALDPDAHSYDNLDKLNASIELKKLLIEIRQLEPYYRDVLEMRFIDGLANDEIADLLGKDEGAVRTQISRALQYIRDNFNQYNI
jgi:RNA polymerase sigma-70 factor (ECF subfamily)